MNLSNEEKDAWAKNRRKSQSPPIRYPAALTRVSAKLHKARGSHDPTKGGAMMKWSRRQHKKITGSRFVDASGNPLHISTLVEAWDQDAWVVGAGHGP